MTIIYFVTDTTGTVNKQVIHTENIKYIKTKTYTS